MINNKFYFLNIVIVYNMPLTRGRKYKHKKHKKHKKNKKYVSYKSQKSQSPSQPLTRPSLSRSPTTKRKLSYLKRQYATRKIQTAFRKDKCAICLERINKKIRDECHNFHFGCINTWVDRGNRKCPLCRAPVGRRQSTIYAVDALNRYNSLFNEYINELKELKEQFDDIDPEYLNETRDEISNVSLNDSIDEYLEVCQRFIRINEVIIYNNVNNLPISENIMEIMSNIETTKINTEQLINDLKYNHLIIIQEIEEMRATQ